MGAHSFDNRGKLYNEITKCGIYAKKKETLYQTKCLGIYSFSVIIDWLNSLLICSKILNENNIYEEIKDGLLILKLIKIYIPHVEIRGIFLKAIKKKCAIQNLENALSIIYKNNTYYYSIVSSVDIYEQKEKKVNIFLIQLFDRFEFQNLKNISRPLLNWYNYTLKKFSLSLYRETINNPFHITTSESIFKYDKNKNLYYNKNCELNVCTQHSEFNISYENNNPDEYAKDYKTKISKKEQICILKNFATYILYKDKKDCPNQAPYIVKDFSDCIKIFFIFYRHGYLSIEELKNVAKPHITNTFYLLHSLLRKLNIPIILQNNYLSNPCEVAILLQLKYIQCFIHNNGYEKSINLKGEFFFSDLLRKKWEICKKEEKKEEEGKKKKKKKLECTHEDIQNNEYDRPQLTHDNNMYANRYIKRTLQEYNKRNIHRIIVTPDMENREYEHFRNKIAMCSSGSEIDEKLHTLGQRQFNIVSICDEANDEIEKNETELITGIETKFHEKGGEKIQDTAVKYVNNEKVNSTTRGIDECEHEKKHMTRTGKKKKKKIHKKDQNYYTHSKQKELVPIYESLEKEIFRGTSIKDIRKMFYDHINENINAHKKEQLNSKIN
ncbi:conserved Plasmodium protein, unknown function [Plasmodium malariae]|uniref:Calponin-homology (CH) domain-containing protein n=1 Tax=Plasmodium malariae TaxID=5858 RepID=A0A1C3KLB2_PLAMA|nr:conserved Plasmodium protein, unknown function [Plasmodium malariae]